MYSYVKINFIEWGMYHKRMRYSIFFQIQVMGISLFRAAIIGERSLLRIFHLLAIKLNQRTA